MLSGLLLAGCGGGPGSQGSGGAESDSFTVTGPVKADSGPGHGPGGGCQWTPAVFDLKFQSGQLSNAVQVKFDVTVGVGGLADVDAANPVAADGSTPVELVVAGKTLQATSGTVHVTDADLGAKKWKGSIDTTFTDGTRLTGSWSCQAS